MKRLSESTTEELHQALDGFMLLLFTGLGILIGALPPTTWALGLGTTTVLISIICRKILIKELRK